MSILLIGDLHFKLDNLAQCDQLQSQVEEMLGGVDHVILLGDIMHYHEKIHVSVLNRVVRFVQLISSRVSMTILVGNHDMVNNQIFCDNTGHWMSVFCGWKNVTVVDVPQYIFQCGLKIAAVPYVYTGRFAEALDTFGVDLYDADLCVAHQEFEGCKMGAITSAQGDQYHWKTPCYSGHIHDTQVLGPVTYTGSAFEHSFGSTPCYLWLLDARTMAHTKIPSRVDAKRSLYTKLKSGATKLTVNVPDSATPHLTKCVVSVDRLEDYLAWLGTKQGIELSKRMTIVHNMVEHHSAPTKTITTNVVTMFRELVSTQHPDCVDLMNTILS